MRIGPKITIPREEFEFRYDRSSGPGGQNVNKVNSKATLRWSVTTTPSLPDAVRRRFVEAYGNRINKEGQLVVASQRYRDQAKNVEDCLSRVREMVMRVAAPPRRRKKTRPTLASKRRRLEAKRQQSQKKQRRRPPRRE